MTEGSVRAIRLLSAVLDMQVRALRAGLPVGNEVSRTYAAMCVHLRGVKKAKQQRKVVCISRRRSRDQADIVLEHSQCCALLWHIIRRACNDWVLYRNTRKPERALAMDAYIWLFEEKPGHPAWVERQKNGQPLMAFLNICEQLNVDPEVIRKRAREMTKADIMSVGRPAERRRARPREGVEDYTSPSQLDSIASGDGGSTLYEAHFSVGN